MSNSKQPEVSPGSSTEVNTGESNPSDLETAAEGPEDLVQDQIIIAPEVMKKVLRHLDLRGLKTVRRVCKSWLREAQFYMEKRGSVRLYMEGSPERIQDFISVRQDQIPALPQPFEALDVELNTEYEKDDPLNKKLITQLSSLCPPLLITRLSLESTDMNLVLPFIVHCSASLEYLKLSIEPSDLSYSWDPKQKFLNLRHIKTEIAVSEHDEDDNYNYSSVPSVLALIVEGSPNLDTYESRSECFDAEPVELASELLLKVNIKNVKTLILTSYCINMEAAEHFPTIQFSRLQYLRIGIATDEAPIAWINQVLVATLRKSASTLRIVDLSCMEGLDDEELGALGDFECPNVQELTMASFPYENHFIDVYFPNLRILNIRELELFEQIWSYETPLFGLQTLRVLKLVEFRNDSDLEHEQPIESQFLDKFPDLERLYLEPSFLLRCCRLKGSGEPFSNLLEGVKHLELMMKTAFSVFDSRKNSDNDFVPLAVLKGIETITVWDIGAEITSVPVEDLPSLKLLQFPWDLSGVELDMNELLRVARGVEKVVVTNCCSVPRAGNSKSKELLEIFFASAPNAQCGCKGVKNNIFDESFWWPGDQHPDHMMMFHL